MAIMKSDLYTQIIQPLIDANERLARGAFPNINDLKRFEMLV
jgi:hypothetical protein